MTETNLIILIIVGLVALMLGYWFGKKCSLERVKGGLIEKQAEEKSKNLEVIMSLFDKQEKVINNQAEQMLGISDATAERYLDELEHEGKIKQVGKTGRDVFYEKA